MVAAGGTGGHLFPAQALADQLTKEGTPIELMFLGGGLEQNPYFRKNDFVFREVASAPMEGRKPLPLLKSFWQNFKGVCQSFRILKGVRPDVVVSFGSYHTFPVLVAAKILRIPLVLHEANAVPGRVTRFFSKSASVTGVHFPDAASLLKGKTVEVGLPLRPGYVKALQAKERARKSLSLSEDMFTLLAFGGSQGALSINLLFQKAVMTFLSERTKQFQVIHITGDPPLTARLQHEYDQAGITSYVTDFLPEMDQALMAADLAICRAGASALAEIVELELPSILIPYPHAKDQHQDKNADYVARSGGAIKLMEFQLTPQLLADKIFEVTADEKALLKEMQKALGKCKGERPVRELSSLIFELVGLKVR